MFRISLEEINAVIRTLPDDKLFSLADAFWKKASVDASGEVSADWRLMGDLCGMMLRSSDSRHPFHALSQRGSKRSLIPSDLTKDELDSLAEIVEQIESKSLQARLFDVLWTVQKTPDAAKRAISIYLEIAKERVDPDKWTTSATCLERALRLGRSLGAAPGNIEAASSLLVEFLEKFKAQDRFFLSFRCLELAIEFGIGARTLLEEVIQNGINIGLESKDFRKVEKYCQAAERFFRALGDSAREREQKIKLAESFVLRAENAELEGNCFAASHFYHDAITAYRRIGGAGAEIEKIKSRLPAIDAKSVAQMKPVGTEIDLTELVNRSRAQVSDIANDRVIYAICWLKGFSNFDSMANVVKNNIKEAPLSSIMGASIVDKNGRTVAKYGPIDLLKPDLSRDDLWPRAAKWMDVERSLFVAGGLMPALSQVLADHSAEEIEILKFIEFSRFVPTDRVESFERGIRAGLLGDWMGVAGLLIPQIEHSARMLMDERGLPIDKVNPDGTHEYIELNSMLSNDEVQRLLGPDLAFELRSLLTDKFGPNLRNKHAHGLLSDEDYDSHNIKYFWWLVVRAISEFPKEHER
jgi:hypothetical protein